MLSTIIAVTGLLVSIFTLCTIFLKIARWIDRQKEQDEELGKIRHEQTIITAGVLACLKSLVGEKDEKEVKNAIQMIENHLNEEAHK